MNHRLRLPALAASAAALLASCTMVSVSTDADPQTDFTKYKTYALSSSPVSGSRTLSPSSFASLESSLESALAAKGIQKSGSPSFVAVYHVSAKERIDTFPVPDWTWGGGYGHGYYRYWAGYRPPQTMISQYTEGTLIVDFVDNATKRMIWRGTATGIVGTQKENAKTIAEAARKMIAGFPPKR